MCIFNNVVCCVCIQADYCSGAWQVWHNNRHAQRKLSNESAVVIGARHSDDTRKHEWKDALRSWMTEWLNLFGRNVCKVLGEIVMEGVMTKRNLYTAIISQMSATLPPLVKYKTVVRSKRTLILAEIYEMFHQRSFLLGFSQYILNSALVCFFLNMQDKVFCDLSAIKLGTCVPLASNLLHQLHQFRSYANYLTCAFILD